MRIAAVVAVALALVGPAQAKGPIELRICGADACREFRWTPQERADQELVVGLVQAAQPAAPAPAPPLAAYYRATLRADVALPEMDYVPAASVIRRDGEWVRLAEPTRAALARAVAALAPFPRPSVRAAAVNDLASATPSLYEEAFAASEPAFAPPADAPRVRIRLDLRPASPWSAAEELVYVPAANALRREGEWVRASPALAERIERDLAAVRADAGGAPVLSVAIAAVLGIGLLLVAWRTVGRRRSAAPSPAPRRSRARAS